MGREQIEALYWDELNYCRNNLSYFVQTYGHIENKDSTEVIIPFRPWKAQLELLDRLEKERKIIVLKARQLGISWLVLHYIAHMLLSPGRSAIGMSENEDKAKELVRRVSECILKYMPELIAKKGSAPIGWGKRLWYESTALSVTVHTPGKPDSKFECFPSSPNAGRSFTADVLFFDEWAFQQFDREIWGAAFPTINRPNSGQVIGVSTIKRGSLFEDLFTNENNAFYKAFIPWYADPNRNKEWYETTKATLADPVLMTAEYPATIEEALTVPGGAFFPEVSDDSILSTEDISTKSRVNTYFVMDYGLDMLAAYWINRDAYGNAQIVQEYCQPNLTIGAAADIILELSAGMNVRQWLAPPDLWNRGQESGKSRAILFQENGLNLTKVNNDIAAGCSAMKEYFKHQEGAKGRLTILNNCAPNLLKCLKKIQRDDKKPNIYANQPHELTHSTDAIRYFCIYWTIAAENPINRKKIKWRLDMWEDYENANEHDKRILIEKWGEPN